MGSRVSRLLFWGMVMLGGCGSANDAANDGLASSGSGTPPEAGSGSSSPLPSTGGAGKRAAGSGGSAQAGAASAPNVGQAGRTSSAAAGASAAATGGSSGSAAGASAGEGGKAAAGSGGPVPTEKFSFFVTSLEAMQRLSKNDQGFGGDLRYGEATGLAGADKICTEIAESAMPGASAKGWHAFLSAKSAGAGGGVVHAKDRIGKGPWYDFTGRVVAMDLESLLQTRPDGDSEIGDNLPNEKGVPNRESEDVDNHDTVTGSSQTGEYSGGATCEDWTTTTTPPAANSGGGMRGGSRGPMCGHSWPAQSGQSWIQAHNAPGCAPSVSIVQMGGGSGDGIGNSGGYGGIYCFALSP